MLIIVWKKTSVSFITRFPRKEISSYFLPLPPCWNFLLSASATYTYSEANAWICQKQKEKRREIGKFLKDYYKDQKHLFSMILQGETSTNPA